MIWDWNGTLLDDTGLVVDIVNGLLAPRRLPSLDVARYREVFTFPVQDYYARLGFDFAREPFEDLAIEFMSSYIERWPEADLRDGAHHGIAALSRRGVGQSMLSAAEAGLLDAATTHFGLAEVMSHRVGISDYHAVSKVDEGRARRRTRCGAGASRGRHRARCRSGRGDRRRLRALPALFADLDIAR